MNGSVTNQIKNTPDAIIQSKFGKSANISTHMKSTVPSFHVLTSPKIWHKLVTKCPFSFKLSTIIFYEPEIFEHLNHLYIDFICSNCFKGELATDIVPICKKQLSQSTGILQGHFRRHNFKFIPAFYIFTHTSIDLKICNLS